MTNSDLPYPQIAPLGKILGIWAHPDDESWMSGGIMLAARANGQEVAFVTATKGEIGFTDETRWPGSTLGKTRQSELETVIEYMDINRHYWLGYIDGECAQVNTEVAVGKLRNIIAKEKPDTVLTFGPDGWSGHDDHRTVCQWATEACKKSTDNAQLMYVTQSEEWYEHVGKNWDKKCNIYFNIDQPPTMPTPEIDLYFTLPNDLIQRKIAALRLQASQTETMFKQLSPAELHDICSCECFMRTN